MPYTGRGNKKIPMMMKPKTSYIVCCTCVLCAAIGADGATLCSQA